MGWFERPDPVTGTEGDVILRRIGAIIIDLILLGIVTSIIGGVLARGGLTGVAGVLALVVNFGYFIYLEGNYGQTLGKMTLGLVVVTEGGDHIDYKSAAIRTLLRIIDVLPALYLIGFIAVLLTDRKQRLGDLAADTVVVRAR